ncbi:hypothetical protein EHQ19_17540 [Leptospira montravelensis]|uniref:hypothetical protein n=1 Tax=Leptospira montravelensis TaxID=2484961 RepID=UPI0010847A1E|nr:hypothetical protein [Leptospira montravelensis]TGK78648.1 hypothetical protein EHQ19_17540 [Leptospira montravelensis]
MEYNFDDLLNSYFLNQFKDLNNEDDKSIIIRQTIQKLAFLEDINRKGSLFSITVNNRSFLRSLEVYLLLSASDAISPQKGGYYPFQNFYSANENQEIIKSIDLENITITEKIDKIQKLYNKAFSVKNSFHSFWNERSFYIKQKIVCCFYPLDFSADQNLYEEIVHKTFYEKFRNQFTHSQSSMVPPIRNKNDKALFDMKNEIIGISFKDKNKGNFILIDIPLNPEEAKNIFEKKYVTYLTSYKGIIREQIFNTPDELIYWSTQLNTFMNGKVQLSHGLIKVIKMALYERCLEIEGKKCNWNEISPYYA